MRSLDGKVVLLTGASRGLGVDMAHAFAMKGARLALAARNEKELDEVRRSLVSTGAEAVAIPADVSSLESLRGLADAAAAALGPVDVLVNNAGIEHVFDFESTDPEHIAQIVRTNLEGLLLLTRLVVPSMIERGAGHIVNVASVAGLVAVPHNATYSATKHGVVGASRGLRLELADHGIGVSVVCPGFVDGGMFLEWGRKPPAMGGKPVSSRKVALATVDAVVRNRGEVVVASGLSRIADWFQAAIPEVSYTIMRRTGVVGFLREQARINAERR